MCMCHRGGQGRGGLSEWGGGYIYAGVADTAELSLTSEGARLLTTLR